jgi:hypothetical protein
MDRNIPIFLLISTNKLETLRLSHKIRLSMLLLCNQPKIKQVVKSRGHILKRVRVAKIRCTMARALKGLSYNKII